MVATNQIVQIALRLPGPWGASEELAAALKAGDVGYRFDADYLVRESDGWRCEVGASPHDDEIADIFAHDGRLTQAEVRAVAGHVAKVHLTGPGGSVKAARAMVDAATALVRLGAAGVMVDNSTATHSPQDWLSLAGDAKPGGLYWIFTNLAGDEHAVWTTGQHCLGLRDAELPDPPDPEFAYLLVHNFLGYVYQSGKTVHDGDVVDGPGGTIYRARQQPFTRIAPGSPAYNPFGTWRLEAVGEDETWSKDSYHPIR